MGILYITAHMHTRVYLQAYVHALTHSCMLLYGLFSIFYFHFCIETISSLNAWPRPRSVRSTVVSFLTTFWDPCALSKGLVQVPITLRTTVVGLCYKVPQAGPCGLFSSQPNVGPLQAAPTLGLSQAHGTEKNGLMAPSGFAEWHYLGISSCLRPQLAIRPQKKDPKNTENSKEGRPQRKGKLATIPWGL